MDWNELLRKSGIFLKEGVIQFIEEHCYDEVRSAKERQFEDDLITAIKCFIDLKVTDMMILELLQKHYGIDSLYEAKSYIVEAKADYQCQKLKAHLGLSGMDWMRYRKDFDIFEKIKSNPKLLDAPIEKVKDSVEKK